jgi:prephenate dehydrogenase
MPRVALIGLGLIGGSLGLALKKAALPELELAGWSRHPDTVQKAREMGAIDSPCATIGDAVRGADLIIISTPVTSIKNIFRELAPRLMPGQVITDCASTKVQVLKWAQELIPPSFAFVGGHPMAGKELSGIASADAALFQKCTWCLTPGTSASPAAIGAVAKMATAAGARPVMVDAEEHDFMVAGISHLPMLLSAALVNAVSGDPKWPQMGKLASSGFRDASRLASGSPDVNGDICLTNRPAIVQWLDKYNLALARLRGMVERDDPTVKALLQHAAAEREKWLKLRP